MSLSKEINAITECSICTETFIDPRVLPCVHTFCLKCLQAYGKSKKIDERLACPLCRAEFDIPFSDLPVNFFIVKLIDVNKVARKPNENASCDACSSKNDEEDDNDDEPNPSCEIATVYCFDCRQSLCKKCFRVHNRLRHNRCHLVVEFGKKQPDELLKISPTYCEAHQDEIVKFFCSDCQKSICMSCYVECHSSHKCGSIAKVAEDFLEQLREDVAKISGHIEKFLSEEKKLTTKKEEFLSMIENKEMLANDMMKEMSQLIGDRRKQILDDLSSVKSVKLKEFETAGNEIQDLLIMMDSFKKYSQEVMTKATPADVTRLASMLKKRAAELHTLRLDNDLCTYEIDINSLNARKMLTSGDETSAGEVVVYNNRKDNADAYLPFSVALPIQMGVDSEIFGMTTLGDQFYLLRTERRAAASAPTGRRILAAGMLRVLLPDSFLLNGATYNRSSYTQCNFVLLHLQVWYSKDTNGKTLQLEISDLHLVEADAYMSHMTNSTIFNLDSAELGQPSNINQTLTLRTPQKLYNAGLRGSNVYIQATGNNMSLSVTASCSQFVSSTSYSNKTIVIPMTYKSTPASATIIPPAIILEVYDMKVDNASNPGITEVMKPSSCVFLPPIDPTDMVSCSYYDCLYIGDQSSSSIHRVDSRGQITKWPVQNIPNGLSVTRNQTLLVTSSQVDNLLEYTALGVLLREIYFTGLTICPSRAVGIAKNRVIVSTESKLYMASPKEAKPSNSETEDTEKETEKANNTTDISEQKALETMFLEEIDFGNAQQLEDEAVEGVQAKIIAPILVDEDWPESQPITDQIFDEEILEDENILNVDAEKLQDIWAASDTHIRTCIDQFGFIFVLTETKVHLLSPELKYIRELISLNEFGMQNPKHIHFQPESGRLYVASNAGTKQFLVFQVTEGKIAQCVWKK